MSRGEGRWAVENVNDETGDAVRFMETHQEWVADLFCQSAQEAFDAAGRPYSSRVVRDV